MHMNLDKDQDERRCKTYKRNKREYQAKGLLVPPVDQPFYLYNIQI